MEAIILAGGLGTRLRSEVSDVPKAMALINGRPFIEYLLDRLIEGGTKRIIFSLGHKSEFIQSHFESSYKNCEIVYAIEETQLGTGGAIKNAMSFVTSDHVLVVNGDSLFINDLQGLLQVHLDQQADLTMGLKPMKDIERYGTVDLNDENQIIRFNEKQPLDFGLINTGNYIFNVEAFLKQDLPEKFSVEKEFFEKKIEELKFVGHASEGYFLDIGIPEDFKKAQLEIGVFPEVDKSWTLFLDRDGVINKKRDNDYVKSVDELEMLPEAAESIAAFSQLFGRVVIVTNQQGIGKGLMTEEDLSSVHAVVAEKVEALGGKIDAFYFAPQLASENSEMRKPRPGMALKAKEEFPEIDFAKSIMVGDSPSDIEFAKNAGLIPVKIGNETIMDSGVYNSSSLAELSTIFKSL